MIQDCLPWVERLDTFERFTPHEKNMFASIASLRKLAAGDVLCEEGADADDFFIVADGRISVEKRLADGSAETLYYLGPGRLAGQVALVDGGPRSATLRAYKPATVLSYPRAEFERHYRAGSRYCFKLLDLVLSALSEQLRDADNILSSLSGDAGESEEKLRALLDQILASATDIGKV
jgi:CRP-like cAMP-binding protein